MKVTEETEKKENKTTVGIAGWICLALLLAMISGIFTSVEGPLKILDIGNLSGSFGKIGETGSNFIGKGGTGARDGFMQALNLVPGIMFVNGLIAVFTHFGVFDAATILFKPILGFILGLPGAAGIAFSTSFNNTDIGAYMSKDLYEAGEITDDQRTIFVAYQYAGSAVVGNTITTGAAMLPVTVLAVGPILLIEILCKIIGANLVRILLYIKAKKENK